MIPTSQPFPHHVKIVEVGPRDGLQNLQDILPAKTKIELINKLSDTGLSAIEVTSFVSPKYIPQLADGIEVFSNIRKKPGCHYSALVPNLQGLEQAISVRCNEIAIFTAASETFNQKNINCSIAESINRFIPVLENAKKQNIKVRGYISCVLGCPYEGPINRNQVAHIAKELYELGCYEVSLGDTIGVGTPHKAKQLIDAVSKNIPRENIAVHFHDTYGQAIVNIYAALEEGISIIDAAVAGLGGCPYAKGATGNVATEDVVYLLNELNITTGIDLVSLCKVGNFISDMLQRPTQSKVARALLAKDSK